MKEYEEMKREHERKLKEYEKSRNRQMSSSESVHINNPQAGGSPTTTERNYNKPYALPQHYYSHDKTNKNENIASHHKQQPFYHQTHLHDKKLHLIALNTPMVGDIKGVRGADLLCYQQARQAGYTTTFRALVSSYVQDMNKIVYPQDRHTPVVNIKNETLYNSLDEIFQGQPMNPVPIYSFSRRNILTDHLWPVKSFWHGSELEGHRKNGCFCDAWRSSHKTRYGMASRIMKGYPLLSRPEKISCDSRLAVLCIENMSKYNVDRHLSDKIKSHH